MAIHVVNEARRCLHCKKPMCREGCPISTNIPEAIELFRTGHKEEAGEMLYENNPLSVICSLVCDHEKQCEGHCVLGRKGAPVHFSSIENYISDAYLDHLEPEMEPKKGQRVAIIGSGPAGITISVLLARRGYDVTIFESREKIGGVLRYGIPEFRLPKSILDRYQKQLIKLGIKIRPNTAIGRTLTVDDLQRDGYEAIFIGTGVWKPKAMGIPGESLGHVNYAIVLDMAMSQYAYGKLGVYRLAGKQLPFPGGFDKDGNLTSDPGAIEASGRILPTGYWKGSGMAIALDLAAAAMANGKTGADLDREGQGSCTGCCQIFIAYDPYLFGEEEEIQAKFDDRVAAADATTPEKEGGHVTCPGERTAATRARNLAEGVVVDEQVWQQCLDLAAGKMDTKDIASTCILDNMKEEEKK